MIPNIDVVLVLGDQIDEAGFSNDLHWKQYTQRLKSIFRISTISPPLISIVGNHDTEFPRYLRKGLVDRYENYIGSVNSVNVIKNVTFIGINSLSLDNPMDSSLREDTMR